MIFKLIILGLIIYGIYILFIKKDNLVDRMKEKRTAKESEDTQTVIECQKCGVYVSVEEAILKDGLYYCSKECAGIR